MSSSPRPECRSPISSPVMAKPAFRELRACDNRPACGEQIDLVLALGGGAIEHPRRRARGFLHGRDTLLVHLEVALATTLARCQGTEGTRPVLADQANLRARYERRLPLYRRAHITIRRWLMRLTPEAVASGRYWIRVRESGIRLRARDRSARPQCRWTAPSRLLSSRQAPERSPGSLPRNSPATMAPSPTQQSRSDLSARSRETPRMARCQCRSRARRQR